VRAHGPQMNDSGIPTDMARRRRWWRSGGGASEGEFSLDKGSERGYSLMIDEFRDFIPLSDAFAKASRG